MLSTTIPENRSVEKFLHPSPKGLDVLIEQVAAFECKNAQTPLLKAVNHYAKKAVFFHPRCKLWDCEICGQINKELWTWRAWHGTKFFLQAGWHVDFVTLTSHEKLGAAGSIAVFPSAWDKLRKRVSRKYPGFQYFAVPETHKDGRLHVHMIVTANLPKRWWKNAGRACGMGYQTDLQEVENAGVTGYVSKYLAKTLQISNLPKGFRRVRTSQGFPKLPMLVLPDGWTFAKLAKDEPLNDAVERLKRGGYEVAIMGHKTAWSYIGGDPVE